MDAAKVFAGSTVEREDDRYNYGEVRNVTVGFRYDALVVIVWTDREGSRHIISMRKATRGEQHDYFQRLG